MSGFITWYSLINFKEKGNSTPNGKLLATIENNFCFDITKYLELEKDYESITDKRCIQNPAEHLSWSFLRK